MQIGNPWRAILLVKFRGQTRSPPSSAIDRFQAQFLEIEVDRFDLIIDFVRTGGAVMSTVQTDIPSAVIDILAHMGPCTMDQLVELLPAHGWSEVFSAVDDMSRDGRLMLRRSSNSSSEYQVSLSDSCQADRPDRTRPDPVQFCVGCGYLCDKIDPEVAQAPWIEARRYLKKYSLTWIELDRTDDMCPACARVVACGRRRVPSRAQATAAR
ncbi:MAG: hypothetical protein Nkreftii_003046 [Candidatus Nitrospira kreftii]|uniref:Uncharacterized protein n=1 Tax=Candidatus Nitrospira kreftii TaxID=2652173 RepID=A0A7S8FGB8_9BACT|nr:MAG: hypothetical protein Nkreftii_003046 [Candidatus Nitrospira kreftii]